jgi:hypothetical protein
MTTAAKPHIKMAVPTQWAYPNGWAPLNLVGCEALEKYGYRAEAERVARKWINANLLQFEQQGEFFEKYNVVNIKDEPVEGLYPSQTGFGWSNAVFVRLATVFLRPDELPRVETNSKVVLRKVLRDPKTELRRVSGKLNVSAKLNRFSLARFAPDAPAADSKRAVKRKTSTDTDQQ